MHLNYPSAIIQKSKVTPNLRVNYPPMLLNNNAKQLLNLYINYPIISLLKLK